MAVQSNPAIPSAANSLNSAGLKITARDIGIADEKLAAKRQEAEKAAQEFETLFVDMMVKSMRQTAVPEDSSNAEDIYQGMLDSEYSKSMTTANNFGIREQILNWMEQADPTLKTANTQKTKSQTEDVSAETAKIQNEMWALKAASQAYQLSGQNR
ncbi:MAG: rod-binding protein [Silvanigrellaceae bacterium]